MAYFIGLGLIALGLVITIPAFLTWVHLISDMNIEQALEQAPQIFTQFIIGSLITVSGIGVIIWKTLSSGRRPTISISGSSGVNVTLAGRDALVKSTIKDLQQSTNTNIKKIANLLLDLKTAIDTESKLPPDSKDNALEQINVIGESIKESSGNISKKRVKNAISILKGIAAEMPQAIKFINTCNTVLPQIASLIALV